MKVGEALAAVLVGLALASGAVAGERKVTIELGETISLRAEEIPLEQIVTELGEAIPVSVVVHGEALEERVTLAIEAPDWPALISKLLGRESYVLIFDGDTRTPVRLVILWDAVREARAEAARGTTSAGSAEAIESRIRSAALDVLARPDAAGEAIARMQAARDALGSARAALMRAETTDSEDAAALAELVDQAREAYLASIGDLQDHDEARTVEALLPDFEIEDRDTRLATLETLRWLSQTGETPEAVEAVTGSFETAADDAVERAALEVLVRYGDPEAVMRLLEPLALSENPNRDLAVREWIRIRDEQIARRNADLEGDPQLQ